MGAHTRRRLLRMPPRTDGGAGRSLLVGDRALRLYGALLTLAVVAAIAPAQVSATNADTAATEAYLADRYAYAQALVANAPKSLAAVESTARALTGGCPGVLHGAASSLTLESTGGATAGSVRESTRESRQLIDLDSELAISVNAAFEQPDQEASSVLADELSSLTWSNAALTARVHAQAMAEREPLLEASALNVCADMKTWVSSDYRTLSADSITFVRSREAEDKRALAESEGPTLERLLAPYERSRGAKALLRKLADAEGEYVESAKALVRIEFQLDAALGLVSPEAEAVERSEHTTVIARGRTAAGESFVAKAERAGAHEHGCKLSVSIERPPTTTGATVVLTISSLESDCLSHRFSGAEANVSCSEGVLTIAASAPASARAGRLLLSDGREITSPIIRAPKLGGRSGYYYQAVRGPSPIPVSLTELGPHGRPLLTAKLPAVVECTKHPIKYLPGGRPRTLARGRAPDGPSFRIVTERYRYLGHVQFELTLHTSAEPGESAEGGGVLGSVSNLDTSFPPRGEPLGFSPEESNGCTPHVYDILYGVVKAPGEKVLVRIAGRLTALRQVALPRELDAGSAVAYGAFAAPASELIVRGAHGKTIERESLASSARETVERCEGEDEAIGLPASAATSGG